MNLVVFDIDGTLTNTNEVDSDCFTRAFKEVHDIELVDTDWSNYLEATDPGIANEVFTRRFGRLPHAAELQSLKTHYVRLLNESARNSPLLFSQIPGAGSAIRLLRSDPRWHLAIATGSWRRSALIKLATAGLNTELLPAAFAEDSISRVGILRKAIKRAAADIGETGFEKLVYVGDGE